MSYQSIKRVLGETSLERKCRFLFGACLLVLITTVFWAVARQTQQNRNTGRLLVDQVMCIEHWEKLETSDTFKPWVRNLTQRLSNQEYDWRMLRPDGSVSSGPPPDAFEWEVIERFLKNDPQHSAQQGPEFAERLTSTGREYQYYQAVRAEELCLLACHKPPPGGAGIGFGGEGVALGGGGLGGGPPLGEGDLMAVVHVTIPNGPTQRTINWNRAILLSAAIITAFLAMLASYAIVRYVIVKPLRHLRDVSDAVSRGNTSIRAEIHTGDEFESLAVAFNRMLRHLVATQDELRQVNADLDAKVDELAQANMQLYELNRLKSEFLATMSHELRTPLNSILGFSDVLASIDSLDEKQKRYVENIRKSGRMLLEMINDILDLAKIEAGKMDLRPSDFRIEHVVQAQCDMARPLSEKKNIDLETHIPDDLPPMFQDQARVQQILNNLLSNAIKFTPEGGRISVSVRRDADDYLVMQVSDTGVGIAEEDQQTIFEKFRQGRTAMPTGDPMAREYSGTGLGLSIVKELCKLLGGEVTVESELGKGSTFTVRLPWCLSRQPRRESALLEDLEQFSRPRLELAREAKHPQMAPADPE